MSTAHRRALGFYLDAISGRRRDLRARLACAALRCLAPVYGLAVRVRNGIYDRFPARSRRISLPVISVGNLTVGGTGKTPMVEWLARRSLEGGLRPGILCRGYGAERGAEFNDEATWLRSSLPGALVHCDPDRVRGARALRAQDAFWILLDDGFQHRRLRRDLDIVLVDATRPFGFGHLLPRGLLREPPGSLRRADAIVLSRVDQLAQGELDALRQRLHRLAPGVKIFEARHRPQSWLGPDGALPLEALPPRRVGLISALAHPEAFEHSVRELGFEVGTHRIFGDHHRYCEGDLTGWDQEALWLTSTKDWAKLNRFNRPQLRALRIELDLEERGAELWSLVEERIRGGGR